MPQNILIAHANDEERLAEEIAVPLRTAGYTIVHSGTILIGNSVIGEFSKALQSGCPVILCGTVKAIGTGWAHKIINAARKHLDIKIFIIQMEEAAYTDQLSFDENVLAYWRDPSTASVSLVAALQKYYPLGEDNVTVKISNDAERHYKELALESCDIIDLANLPESDRHIAIRKLELRRLYVPLRVTMENGDTETRRQSQWTVDERIWRKRRRLEINRIPIGERLGKARRLVVLGDPGSGKSTMLRWIATAYLLKLKRQPEYRDLPDVATLPDEDLLPVIIRCRDLDTNACDNLQDILTHTFRKSEMTEDESNAFESVIREKLSNGNALLLIDGLDEIADSRARTRFSRQLEQIHVAFPNAPIIVTSRIVGYREMNFRIGRGFEHLMLLDLSPKDKDNFALRWCTLTEVPERIKSAVTELIKDIHSTERIELLTGNPMLLTTLALVKRKVGKLPRRRADLYWEAAQVLLNWRSEVDEPIDPREAIPQLEYLAYAMCLMGVQQLREDELLLLLDKMREEYPQVYLARARSSNEFLQLLERRTGILVQSGHVKHLGMMIPVYEFRHLTFQEYLAALALVHGRFPDRMRSKSLAQNIAPLPGLKGKGFDLWRETLRLCVACCNDDEVDELLHAIITSDESSQIPKRTVLAMLCLADEPNASESVSLSIIKQFVELIRDNQIKVGFKDLFEIGTCRWVSMLKVLLFERLHFIDGDALENFLTIYSGLISLSTAPQGPNELMDFMNTQAATINGSNLRDSVEAAIVVARYVMRGRAIMLPELAEGLVLMLDRGNVAACVGARSLLYFCRQHTLDDQQQVWRLNTKHLDRMVTYITDSKTDILTLRYLIPIVGLASYQKATTALIDFLKVYDITLKALTVEALGRIGSELAIEPLNELVWHAENENIVKTAASALATIPGHRAQNYILAMMSHQDKDVQLLATRGIDKQAGSAAVDALLELTNSDRSKIRAAALKSLALFQDDRIIPTLIAALNDTAKPLRAAMNALGLIGDQRALEAMKHLKDKVTGKSQKRMHASIKMIEDRIGQSVGNQGQNPWEV